MTIRDLKIFSRVMALLVAILVAAPASGLGQLLYFCTMTGEVGPRCCCGHKAVAAALEGPMLAAGSCCEIVGLDLPLQSTRVEGVSSQFETPQLVPLPGSADDRLVAFAPTALALPHGSRGPPPDTGPPLFIQHSSYLI